MLAITTVALLPLPLGLVIWSTADGAGDPNLRVSASPYDIPLLLLTALVLPSVWRALLERLRSPGSRLPWLGTLAVGWFVVATLVHPNWRAVELFFHAVAGGAIAFLLLTSDRRFVKNIALTIAVVAAVQGALAVAQSLTGDTLGIGGIEASTELWTVGQNHAGRGSFLHPYHLTTFLMLGLGAAWILRRIATTQVVRRVSVGLVGVIGLAIPLTFSRAAILALFLIVPIGFIGRERILAATLLIAVVFGSLLGSSGWEQRGETTADPSRVDSGRSERLDEAQGLFESEPFWGVGPGGYAIALSETEEGKLLPAHNVIAQTGAEAGVLGGTIILAALVALGVTSLLGGTLGMLVGATVVNFHLLDAFPHVYPNGIVITGIWVGLIGVALRIRRHPDLIQEDDAGDEALSSPASSRA